MPNLCNNVARISHPDPEIIERLCSAVSAGTGFREFIDVPRNMPEDFYDEEGYNLINAAVERHDATNLTMWFQTPWSPPLSVFHELDDAGFIIEAYYYEPNMNFCGMFEEGEVTDVEIDERTAEWVRANVPSEINELFGIANDFENEMAVQ